MNVDRLWQPSRVLSYGVFLTGIALALTALAATGSDWRLYLVAEVFAVPGSVCLGAWLNGVAS